MKQLSRLFLTYLDCSQISQKQNICVFTTYMQHGLHGSFLAGGLGIQNFLTTHLHMNSHVDGISSGLLLANNSKFEISSLTNSTSTFYAPMVQRLFCYSTYPGLKHSFLLFILTVILRLYCDQKNLLIICYQTI